MANFPVFYRNANGTQELLRPADGGIEIDVIDCELATSAVNLFATVNNTGSLTLFSSYNGVAGVGLAGSTFSYNGSVTVGEDLTVTGISTFNGNVILGNAPGDDITFGGQVASDVAFDNGAARAITIASQSLTISCTVAGILTLSGATEVQIDSALVDVNSTGGIQMDAVTASQLVVSGAAADLTFGARAGTITLNEAGDVALDTSFTATSIIGALNEIKVSNQAEETPAYLASAAITAGDVVCLDWDAGNARVGLYLADNTVPNRRNPIGISLTTGGIGNTIYVATVGQVVVNSVIGANQEGEPLFLDAAGAVTLTPPSIPPFIAGDTSQIVGIASAAGVAGAAEMVIMLHDPQVL
jgi:hypothetical protein